ncbi:hypothetical protein [Ideonella sp.]|uniref:hypothetical protein n=1 Tax=Ideonella sp. TaxID=1929293 RepID=UPI002D803AA6|nr:hypothetical protein [Ideonella sp.]
MPTDAMYAINSMDRDAGWSVSLVRRGKLLQRCFTLFRYGSGDAALAAAQAWRDEQALQSQAYTKAEISQLKRAHNTSGRAGVYLMHQRRVREDGRVATYSFWLARTPDGVKPARSASFSILKFGEAEAYARAVAARAGFERELQGYHLGQVPRHLHPVAGANPQTSAGSVRLPGAPAKEAG